VGTFSLGKTGLASTNPKQFAIRSDYDFFDNVQLAAGQQRPLHPGPQAVDVAVRPLVTYPALLDAESKEVRTGYSPVGYRQFGLLISHKACRRDRTGRG